MATTPTKPRIEIDAVMTASRVPSWPDRSGFTPPQGSHYDSAFHQATSDEIRRRNPSGCDALQALLAFSALHQQVRQRRALAARHKGFETIATATEFEAAEQFVLDEVLQLVAERAIAITGADGLGIALAENNEIVLRASAGAIKPDVGQRIERDSAFSGASFRKAQIIRCDDTESDDRVNIYACRQLGARSMVAVPLCGRRRVIGLLEAFSAEPFGFNDSDVNSLGLLAELIVAALKPEDEERFAESAQVAEAELSPPSITMQTALPFEEAGFEKTDIEQIGSETIASAAAQAPPAKNTSDAVSVESTHAVIAPVVIAPATIAPAVIAPAIIAPAIKEPSPLPLPSTELQSELQHAIENAIVPEETTLESEPPSGHHPGIALVLVLVVISVLLAGGLWWKLKNAQLSKVMVQPEPKITKPVTKQPAPLAGTPSVAPSSITPSSITSTSVNSSAPNALNISPDGKTNTVADAGAGSVTPQERSKVPRVTGIRHWSSDDSSTVVLDLEDQVQYEAHRLASPDRIYFDLHDTSLAAALDGKTIDVSDSLLTRVRVSQPISGVTRVVLETKGKPDFSVSLEPNPYRLVVQVRKLGSNPKAQVNLFPGAAPAEQQKLAIVVPAPSREDLQLRARVPKMRIVVDAGHGGWDLGTVGKRGLLEKDVVLEIAQRLGMLLESRLGADVILTRNDDNYIPLDERAGKANQSQADLFISVHANYSDLPSARGVETYYTNFFSAPNAKDKDFETRDPDHASNARSAVLSAAELHEKIEQSRRLAASVQRSLYGALSVQNPGLRDRGVKEASYVVLTETAMPGILAEVSFVSSPADEQKLRSDGYREQIAEALYKGIARYAAGSRGVKVASAAK
jgi:N-acetylmuramoyl-L-alanine amidase/putative methionine-R-sulfoxide reductase with GAF domain